MQCTYLGLKSLSTMTKFSQLWLDYYKQIIIIAIIIVIIIIIIIYIIIITLYPGYARFN